MKIAPNKILASTAIILSVFAMIAGSPFSSKKSYINPEQFADSLISKKQNLTVIDLQSKKDYNNYHIPSALNANAAGIDPSAFDRNNMIVFYSGKDNASKTMQYKFSQDGFDEAYFLNGGIEGWMDKVIFPILPKGASQKEREEFKKIERRSMYFGGHPEREGGNTKKIYRREGC